MAEAVLLGSKLLLVSQRSLANSIVPDEVFGINSLRAQSELTTGVGPHVCWNTAGGHMGTLMGTLWERAQCSDVQLLNFQEELARQKGFEPLTPRVEVWWGPLK